MNSINQEKLIDLLRHMNAKQSEILLLVVDQLESLSKRVEKLEILQKLNNYKSTT